MIRDNKFFKYSSFKFVNKIINRTNTVNKVYNDTNSLIYNFHGCASFMWTKDAIKEIGYYNTNINGCEDWEYLLRTFNSKSFQASYEKTILMDYIRHNDALYHKETKRIVNLKKNIISIWIFLQNNNNNIIYYSKYKNLSKRPKQLMRSFNNSFNKIFIEDVENIEIQEKHKLLIVPYTLKDCVFNFINNQDKYIYYTDHRLYDEIINIEG